MITQEQTDRPERNGWTHLRNLIFFLRPLAIDHFSSAIRKAALCAEADVALPIFSLPTQSPQNFSPDDSYCNLPFSLIKSYMMKEIVEEPEFKSDFWDRSQTDAKEVLLILDKVSQSLVRIFSGHQSMRVDRVSEQESVFRMYISEGDRHFLLLIPITEERTQFRLKQFIKIQLANKAAA